MHRVTRNVEFSKSQFQLAVTSIVATLERALPDGAFADREKLAHRLLGGALRDFGERELQRIADSFDEEVLVNGERYRRHQEGTVQYYSLAGTLSVTRSTYRQIGVRNGPTLVPMEVAAGLVHRATPALANNLAHGYAEHDIRTHCELLGMAHCVAPPRATAERIAKAIAHDAHESAPRIERISLNREKLPEGAVGVAIGLDRTSVPMAEELPKGTKKPKVRRKTPYQRRPPARFEVNWRMAYVGTVCLVDENGDAIRTYRYAASASDDPAELVRRMQAQLASVLRQASLSVAIVQDGAPEMWNQMRAALEPLRHEGLVSSWHEVIDLPHLLGRLSEAFQLIGKGDAKYLEFWKKQLLKHYCAIDNVELMLRLARESLSPTDRVKLDEHLGYIENNKDRMRYTHLREAGLPVGSGVTESAAKNVINMRTKRSGQHWSVPGLRGVLALRALLKSERLPAFWRVFSRRYVATVSNLEAAA